MSTNNGLGVCERVNRGTVGSEEPKEGSSNRSKEGDETPRTTSGTRNVRRCRIPDQETVEEMGVHEGIPKVCQSIEIRGRYVTAEGLSFQIRSGMGT